jgi:hypothetical protein
LRSPQSVLLFSSAAQMRPRERTKSTATIPLFSHSLLPRLPPSQSILPSCTMRALLFFPPPPLTTGALYFPTASRRPWPPGTALLRKQLSWVMVHLVLFKELSKSIPAGLWCSSLNKESRRGKVPPSHIYMPCVNTLALLCLMKKPSAGGDSIRLWAFPPGREIRRYTCFTTESCATRRKIYVPVSSLWRDCLTLCSGNSCTTVFQKENYLRYI